MNLDDKVCYCYHVSLRKLVNFAQREKPQRASQMSLCLGAGTGCGWCIPILRKIYEKALAENQTDATAVIENMPASADAYAEARKAYLKSDAKNVF